MLYKGLCERLGNKIVFFFRELRILLGREINRGMYVYNIINFLIFLDILL